MGLPMRTAEESLRPAVAVGQRLKVASNTEVA